MPNHSFPIIACAFPPLPLNRARTTAYSSYIHEILGHAGVCYGAVERAALFEALPGARLLVTAGQGEFSPDEQSRLETWIASGGSWLALGNACGLEQLFGAEADEPQYRGWGVTMCTLGEGYMQSITADHPVLNDIPLPLHFFNGAAVRAAKGRALARVLDAHQRPTERAAIIENAHGAGRCMLIAPDLTGAVVRIQQGVAITRDGVPSNDGTAPSTDGVLKADDGATLDYLFDRQTVEGAPGLRAFLEPIADLWREVFLRGVFYLAREQKIAFPVLWLYPRNLPALGHISHDTDGNSPAHARLLLDTLARADIRSTWCVIAPGYDGGLIEDIRAAGHELATHYNAMDDGLPWGEEQFDRQWRELAALFGGQPVTNKNHYLRWEGDTEFYEWLLRRGFQLDQSKGPSKTGQAGFLFGSCHPYFPLRPDGSAADILELPTHTQDLIVFAPGAILPPLANACLRRHGILHLLFHPGHIDKSGVADILIEAVRLGREAGMEWWTAAEINTWERARRQAQWSARRVDADTWEYTVDTPPNLKDATILWPSTSRAGTIQRWGFHWRAAESPGLRKIASPR